MLRCYRPRVFCPYLRQMLIDFQNYFTVTLDRKFAIERSLQIPHISKASLHYLAKYYFPKSHRLKAQQQKTKCVRTVKECDRGRRAATKQLWPDKNSSFDTSNSTIWGRMDHFLHSDLGLKCSERCLLKNWVTDWSKLPCETPPLKTVAEWCCLQW